MREYVEPIYGWDLDVQQRYHTEWFTPDRLLIIEDDDGTLIGVLDVSDEGDHLYLSRIEVLPEALLFGTIVQHIHIASPKRERSFHRTAEEDDAAER
jgi:hypothetical protein